MLHMIRDFFGDARFGKGVNRFLTGKSFESATTDEFLELFGEGAGKDVSDILERWIRRPGIPIVTANRDKTTITLTQRRFILGSRPDDPAWPIPLTILALSEDGVITRHEKLFDGSTDTIKLPEGTTAYKVNAAQAGLYRVAYDESSLSDLTDTYRVWSTVDRAGIIGDLNALHFEGSISVGGALSFVSAAGCSEDEERPLREFCGLLFRCHSLLPETRDRVTSLAIDILEPQWERLGAVPVENESVADNRLRPDMLWWLFRVAHSGATEAVTELARSAIRDEFIAADLYPVALRVAAATGMVAPDWFEDRLADAGTSEVTRRHLLSAIGWFTRELDNERVLDYAISKVAPKNLHYPVSAVAANPDGRSSLLPWLMRSVEALSNMQNFASSRVVATAIPPAGIGKIAATQKFVDTQLRRICASGPLDMALEQMKALDRYVARNTTTAKSDT